MTDATQDIAAEQAEADAEAQSGLDEAAAPQLSEVEQLAVEAGWKPESEWKGEGHQSAAEFLKHQASSARDAKRQAKEHERRLERVQQTTEKLLRQQEAQLREELEGRHADAVAANNATEARRIAGEIQALEAQPVKEGFDDFKSRNDWFGSHEDASAYAFGIAQIHANRGADAATQFREVEKAVKTKFPELFGDAPPAKKQATALPQVGAPGARTSPVKARTYEALPSEAKAASAAFEARLDTPEAKAKFRKSYAETYWKENA